VIKATLLRAFTCFWDRPNIIIIIHAMLSTKRRNPKLHWTLAGLFISLLLTFLLTVKTPISLHPVIMWLIATNVTTFAFYGLDKSFARRRLRTRIPELTLQILALVGGTIGALAGMEIFRHKTVKGSFRIIFFLIVALQIVLALWL
jgi:uncharacterized membrane protein YsdA (DUF1294 family)